MTIPPWLFGLITIPIFYVIAFILYHVMTEVRVFLSFFVGLGIVVGIVLFLIKWTGRERFVSPINGDRDTNYDLFYRIFSDKGFKIDEYEPLDGRQMDVYLDHPRKGYFILAGVFLLMVGFLPGMVWFFYGRDRFSFTLKESAGFVYYIIECNSRYAGRVWGKIISRISLRSISPLPENVKTTIERI